MENDTTITVRVSSEAKAWLMRESVQHGTDESTYAARLIIDYLKGVRNETDASCCKGDESEGLLDLE